MLALSLARMEAETALSPVLKSATNLLPGTPGTLNFPEALTVPKYWLPSTVTVTMSPALNSPVTMPVMVTLPLCSARLRKSSPVMASMVSWVVAGDGGVMSTA